MSDDRLERYMDALLGIAESVDAMTDRREALAVAAMRVADAEQQHVASENERLCLEVENLRTTVEFDLTYQRGLEAKVARVEALADEWDANGEDDNFSLADVARQLRSRLAPPHVRPAATIADCPACRAALAGNSLTTDEVRRAGGEEAIGKLSDWLVENPKYLDHPDYREFREGGVLP